MPAWAWFILAALVVGLLLGAHRAIDALWPGRAAPPGPPRRALPPDDGRTPFRVCASLLTPAEVHFFQALAVAIAGEHLIFAKVRLGDLLEVPSGTPDEQAWRNRVQSKHLDFVVCDRVRACPLVAIELDDSSHRRPDRVERDELVERFCRDAGLTLVRFRVERAFDHRAIRDRLAPLIGMNQSALGQ